MIPIKLTIQGFLAFKNKVVVDFTNVYDEGLFLISGPTGSGKTSIFDAMVFALYGSVSTSERAASQEFRSLLIDEDDNMLVEFIFSIGKQEYTVRRWKDGKKEIKQIFFKDGLETEGLTKKSEIKEEVEYITGLTLDQFKKIVLLPQGEFRNFLMSGTKEKSEILRNLFDTKKFEKLKWKIKEKYDELDHGFQDAREELDREKQISDSAKQAVKPEEIEELINSDLEASLKELSGIQKEIDLTSERIKLKDREFQIAEKNNKLLEQFKDATENLNKLILDEDENFKKKEKANLLNKIKPMVLQQSMIIADERELFQLNKEHTEKTEELAKIKEELDASEADYLLNKERNNKLDVLNISAENFRKKLEKADEYLSMLKSFASVEKEYKDLLIKEDEYNKALSEKEILNSRITKISDSITENILIQNDSSNRLNTAVNKIEKLNQFLDEEKLKNNFEKELAFVNNNLALTEKKYSDSVNLLNEMQHSFDLQDLAKYSDKVIHGSPCPLCGSLEHPSIIQKAEGYISASEIAELRNRVQSTSNDIAKYNSKIEALIKDIGLKANFLEEKSEQLGEIPSIELLQKYTTEKIDLEVSIKGLKRTQINLNEDKKALEHKRSETTETISKFENLKPKFKEIQEKYSSMSAVINLQKAEFENIDTYSLKAEIEKLKATIEKIKSEITNAEENIRNFKSKHDSLDSLLNNILGNIQKLQDKLKTSRIKFDEDLKTVQLKEDEFSILLGELDKESLLLEESENYFNKLKEQRSLVGFLQKNAEGLEFVDTVALTDSLDELAEYNRELNDKQTELNKKNTLLESALNRVKNARIKYESLEDKVKIAKQFWDLASKGVNFENFVLSYYLDGVLNNANSRLLKISQGRFKLTRKVDPKMDRRKSQGLELNVFDLYTNSERDVKTLSGGEGFKASLALALGLSDFIRESRTGMKIDSIFIDEGFGTLDQDSLRDALDMIMELNSNGRLVGIISHVEELKDVIINKFIVESHGANGSTVRFSSSSEE